MLHAEVMAVAVSALMDNQFWRPVEPIIATWRLSVVSGYKGSAMLINVNVSILRETLGRMRIIDFGIAELSR